MPRMGPVMTAEEADDHVSEFGTGTPKTPEGRKAAIILQIHGEEDAKASEALRVYSAATDPDTRRVAFEVRAIHLARRDAIWDAYVAFCAEWRKTAGSAED